MKYLHKIRKLSACIQGYTIGILHNIRKTSACIQGYTTGILHKIRKTSACIQGYINTPLTPGTKKQVLHVHYFPV